MKRTLITLGLLLAAALVVPALAGAQELVAGPGDAAPVSDGPATNAVNLYLVVLGGLTPLAGYVLNHYAPWVTEPVKGIVQAVLAAGVAVLYQAVSDSDLGLNDQTLLAALTAMISALLAHVGWKAAVINVALGGGSNRAGQADGERGQADPLYLLVVVIVIVILVYVLLKVAR